MKKNISRRRFVGVIGLCSLGAVSTGLYNSLQKEQRLYVSKWEGIVLGAPSKIEIHHHNKLLAQNILSSVLKDINYYENLFSLYKTNSQLSILNRLAVLRDAEEEFITLLLNSKKLSEVTKGAFDITVQPLWNLYEKHYIKESNNNSISIKKIEEIKKLVNWENIIIKKSDVYLKNKKMSLTLNGIAQGWITDLVALKLKNKGINNVLIDLGETYALGKHRENRPWHIALRGKDGIAGKVNLVNKAVATSGGYGTTFEKTGKNHHVFNPKTGLSANRHEALSIVADSAWIADGLSTAGLSMTKPAIKKAAVYFNAKAYIIKNNIIEEI